MNFPYHNFVLAKCIFTFFWSLEFRHAMIDKFWGSLYVLIEADNRDDGTTPDDPATHRIRHVGVFCGHLCYNLALLVMNLTHSLAGTRISPAIKASFESV